MPIEKKYPIEDVCDEIRKHNWYGQRRVTFEYIVFKGKNDTYEHAKEISYLLRGIESRVNLIRYHSTPEYDVEGANEEGNATLPRRTRRLRTHNHHQSLKRRRYLSRMWITFNQEYIGKTIIDQK